MTDKPKPPASRDPPWNIQAAPNARGILAQQCPAMLKRILESTDTQKLAFLTDTRAVHKELFAPFVPEGFDGYAGTYRGTPGTVLEDRRTAIFYHDVPGLAERYPTLAPQSVLEYMLRLNGFIEKTFRANSDDQTYFHNCMRIFGDFLIIHPYLDGNGHIMRMMMIILADHKGIEICPTWTIHPRPYNHAIGICLHNYQHYPELLEQYLKIWFKV